MDDKLNFVLLGKTGEGKSATGNSILNRQYFKTSNSASHETKELSYTFRIFGNYSFVVVDGPDLISGAEDQIETSKNTIIQALAMCYGSVDAFLFVMKFGNKFTAKDNSALEALKQVLGDRYLDHVIVVVTYGDVYQSQLQEEECEPSFDDWCIKQTGEFRQLYVSCKKRFVLFNNKEKDEEKMLAQVEGLVQLVLDVREKYGRYTSQYLKHSEGKVERLMPELTKRQEQATVQRVETKQIKQEVKLNFLLLGKTGQGKSATGNSILQRKAFTASASVTSVTKEVDFSFSRFKHYTLLVVDGPGLADTELHHKKNTTPNVEEEKMNMAKEIAKTAKHMDKALVMCYGGVDAFLFVMKFGSRFTAEEQSTLESLKHIFGDHYLDHVIVVVTCGDLFPGENEDQNISFDEWCRKQTGAFRDLYADCKGRFVLFNNREKDEEKKRSQIQKIVKLAEFLKTSSGRYTSECFQDAESGRQKVIQELKAPLLTREIQEKICLLTADIEHLDAQPSDTEKENIRARIQDLRREIERQDHGYNVLGDLLKKVKDMEGNLDKQNKMKHTLNFLLMGKTGHGKSATGNSLLNRRYFTASANHATTTVDFSFSKFGNCTLLVVDGPGLANTNMSKVEDTIYAVKNMDKAIAMCYGGVDAFLFVFKFGRRFTAEDRSALEALKRIFGPSYLDHVIVVMTGGDLFQSMMEEEEMDISFHEWCRQQTGEFRQLYDDCRGRFVLFNNREENEGRKRAQVQELVQLTQDLSDKHGRYTSQCFKDAEREREKLILELKAPQLTRELQEKISLLTAEIEKLSSQPPDSALERIRSRILDVRREVDVQDQGYGVLDNMRRLLDNLQDNVEQVIQLGKQANARRTPTVVEVLGSLFGLR